MTKMFHINDPRRIAKFAPADRLRLRAKKGDGNDVVSRIAVAR